MNFLMFTTLHLTAASLLAATNANMHTLSFFVAISSVFALIKIITNTCSAELTKRYNLESDFIVSCDIGLIFLRSVASMVFMVIYETTPSIIKPTMVAPSGIIFVLMIQTALTTVEIVYSLAANAKQGRPA